MDKISEYFKGDELAIQVWNSKYRLKNKEGEFVENTVEERFKTIADEIERALFKVKYKHAAGFSDKVYKLLLEKKIIPAGSILYGVGNPYSISSLGNCFVSSLMGEDSYGAIMRVDEELVQISKRRGGDGIDLSSLRPAGAKVNNSARFSTGVVSFAERFSNSTREVAQDGRRGALMLTMHINHPDVEYFIKSKRDNVSLTGANISVKLTDEFMRAVENDDLFIQRFPIDAKVPQDLKNKLALGKKITQKDGTIVKVIKAKELWDEIIYSNWAHAEPGVLFWDKIIKESPADIYPEFKTVSTNPCGELPLSPYSSCRLLSIIAPSFVKNSFTKDAYFDYDEFTEVSEVATIAMDAIVTLEIEKIDTIIQKIQHDPESDKTKRTELDLWKKIKWDAEAGRRLGLSAIGHGDLFAKMGLNYAQEESISLAKKLQSILAQVSYVTSCKLGRELGTFLSYNEQLEIAKADDTFLCKVPHIRRRNVALLTIPPSGSISIISSISSGIEPVFSLAYTRRRKVDKDFDGDSKFVDDNGDVYEQYNVIHPGLLDWFAVKYPELDPVSMSMEDLMRYSEGSPYYGNTANDIDYMKKVELQASIQEWVDHSISVTHNMPESASKEEVSDILMYGWKMGNKGMTIYRDGSRSGVLVNSNDSEPEEFIHTRAPKRPKKLPCDVFQSSINGEAYILLVGLYKEHPYETFAFKKKDIKINITKGIIYRQKSGLYHLLDSDGNIVIEDILNRLESPEWSAVTRMTSLALRHGAGIEFVVEDLNKAEGFITDPSKVLARQLKKRYLNNVKLKDSINTCPVCGEPLVMEGGCNQCVNPDCGWSACG